MEKINPKTRKDIIFAEYKKILGKYQKLAEEKKTLKDKMVEAQDKDLVSEVADFDMTESFDQAISKMIKNVEKEIIGIAERRQESLDQFQKIQEAIDIKRNELKETFGIETELFNLMSIKEAQDLEKTEFDHNKAIWEESLKSEIEEKKAVAKQLIDDALKKEHLLKEEFDYNFERMKQRREDELNDSINATKKKILEEYDNLNKQKKAFEIDKKSFEGNKEKIFKKVKEKYEQLRDYDKKRHEQEIERLEGLHSSKVQQLEFQTKMLNSKTFDLQKENAALQQKLDDAYQQIKNLAREAVNSSGKEQELKKLYEIFSNKNQPAK